MYTPKGNAAIEAVRLLDGGPGDLRTGTRIWPANEVVLREVLIWAACPVVCSGVSTPPENWHDLCEKKADEALARIFSVI